MGEAGGFKWLRREMHLLFLFADFVRIYVFGEY